jgi:hypothetical protein
VSVFRSWCGDVCVFIQSPKKIPRIVNKQRELSTTELSLNRTAFTQFHEMLCMYISCNSSIYSHEEYSAKTDCFTQISKDHEREQL